MKVHRVKNEIEMQDALFYRVQCYCKSNATHRFSHPNLIHDLVYIDDESCESGYSKHSIIRPGRLST